jgi:hypothetical protein
MEEKEANGIKRREDGTFDVGTIGGPGRPVETEKDKIIKKATKELIAEYKEALGESLPLIRPILIAKALDGDISAIKEIHDRVMDKAKQATDITTGGQPIIVIPQAVAESFNINATNEQTGDSNQG